MKRAASRMLLNGHAKFVESIFERGTMESFVSEVILPFHEMAKEQALSLIPLIMRINICVVVFDDQEAVLIISIILARNSMPPQQRVQPTPQRWLILSKSIKPSRSLICTTTQFTSSFAAITIGSSQEKSKIPNTAFACTMTTLINVSNHS